MDVAVISPFTAKHLREESPCEAYAQHDKHARYDEGFVNSNYAYIPMVFETTGGLNSEGQAFFAKLLLAARNFQSDPHSVHMGRGWQTLSCVLQCAIAQMVVNRTTD